jgi:hypothetical protein
MDDASFTPEIGRTDFLAADALDRARFKAGRQRLLKRRLDDACDELQRAAAEVHGAAGLGQAADDIADRIRIGEAVAAFAHKLAAEICALEPYGARPEPRALSEQMLAALFDWPLDAAMSDGVARAAAEHELERIA